MKKRDGIDPLKDFSEAAREELRAFTPQYAGDRQHSSAGLPLPPCTARLLAAAKKLAHESGTDRP
jgi:hypothetical protein